MNNLTTLSHEYYVARAIAAEDASLTTALATAGDHASKPASVIDLLERAVECETEMISNGICFVFAGTTAANKTFNWKIYAWRNCNGPAELVANGTGVLGTQQVVKYPHNGAAVSNVFWADTLTVSNDLWMKSVEATDSTGNNSVAKVWVDTCGYRYWYVEIETTGTADPATNIVSYYGYF